MVYTCEVFKVIVFYFIFLCPLQILIPLDFYVLLTYVIYKNLKENDNFYNNTINR